jgi:hypothetical protein
LLLILPVGLIAMGLLGAENYYVERSALAALPFFAIAIGIGITSLVSMRLRVVSTALIACFGAVVLTNYYARTDRFTVYYPNPDWRAGAQWLRERSAPAGPVIVLSFTEAEELLYYDRGLGRTDTRALTAGVPPEKRRAGGLRQRLKVYMSPPLDTLRGKTRRLYRLARPTAALISDALAREQVAEFFVVTNRFIVNNDRLRDAVASDSTFHIEEVFEPRGLRLLHVRRIAGDASGG